MKNVIILGASSNIAKQVIDIFAEKRGNQPNLVPRKYTKVKEQIRFPISDCLG